MKAFYTLAAIATFAFASAQKGTDLNGTKSIAINGNLTVTFVKASKSSIEVTRGKAANLKIASDGENTALSVQGDEALEATIYYAEAVENLAVGSNASVYSKDAFTGETFGLAVAAGSKVQVSTKVQTLQVAAASGAQVTITGSAGKIEAAVASGAQFNSQKLEVADAQMVIASGAKASVNATGTVEVNVASGGELTIYGNPKKVNEVKAADGVIKRA